MPNQKKATIYDVAQTAGVSITTVSRVLNSPEKVKTKTREDVLAAIDSLHYVPKAEARARAMQNTGRIGVISPFFTAPSFSQRLRGIAKALTYENCELIVYTVDSNERLDWYLSSLPATGNLDGLIILALPIAEKDVDRLIERGLHTVLIEYPHPKLNCVEIDDINGGYMAANYLISKGHTEIAFLGDTDLPEYAIHPVNLRLEGFRRAMKEHGLTLREDLVRLSPYSWETTQAIANEILHASQPPTAFFAATDLQALGVLKAAREMNVRVPEDVAILGFDDLYLARYTDLTTISQHLEESGRLAVEILLSQIDAPARPPRHVKIPLTLIERQTV